jgi:hypothetical protein
MRAEALGSVLKQVARSGIVRQTKDYSPTNAFSSSPFAPRQ